MMVPRHKLAPSLVPSWEETCPDRFAFELDDLEPIVRDSLYIDEDALASGVLSLSFEWPLRDGNIVPLRAEFPDSYPFVRPAVFLNTDPRQFPKRHCSPLDGMLCLLGRDTGLWPIKWTLARLLENQLENALQGQGLEDPQGEPIEVWWNHTAASAPGSFVLVDSSWNLGEADEGSITLRFIAHRDERTILFNAAVEEVRSADGSVIVRRDFPLPRALAAGKVASFPWRRREYFPPYPADRIPEEVRRELARTSTVVEMGLFAFSMSIIVQQTELSIGKRGDSWLFALQFGPKKSFRHAKPNKRETRPSLTIVPTYRAGKEDIGSRVPGVGALRGKTVAVVGLGGIGGPLALELARNGCSRLMLVDHDVVEPGNSIRWPLGSSAWGSLKAHSLADFIRSEFPWCEPFPEDVFLGAASPPGHGDDALFAKILGGADLIVDATASSGISRLLAARCRTAGKPLVSVFGTLSLKGGVVAGYHPMSGCPTCREFLYQKNPEMKAPGSGDMSGLLQPAGCAEATFTGSSYDLKELSLEAIRMIVDVLTDPDSFHSSVLHTLSLYDGRKRQPPIWRVDQLPAQEECGCQKL
ncbi:MAG: hypothetical protein EOR22_31075 [Mesorhizobium sp.]|nr:MAG: hypothetical protein EOR22_31075 [Mesorhizobium sp.]